MDMLDRSELAQDVGANDLAESFMAFNTNYRDSGLFGVYAVAKVCGPLKTVSYFFVVSCSTRYSMVLIMARVFAKGENIFITHCSVDVFTNPFTYA